MNINTLPDNTGFLAVSTRAVLHSLSAYYKQYFFIPILTAGPGIIYICQWNLAVLLSVCVYIKLEQHETET